RPRPSSQPGIASFTDGSLRAGGLQSQQLVDRIRQTLVGLGERGEVAVLQRRFTIGQSLLRVGESRSACIRVGARLRRAGIGVGIAVAVIRRSGAVIRLDGLHLLITAGSTRVAAEDLVERLGE